MDDRQVLTPPIPAAPDTEVPAEEVSAADLINEDIDDHIEELVIVIRYELVDCESHDLPFC